MQRPGNGHGDRGSRGRRRARQGLVGAREGWLPWLSREEPHGVELWGMKTSTRTSSRAGGQPAADGVETNGVQPIPKGMTLSGYIRERFEEFSRSQKDVARYIVDHLEEAAFQTAEELARRADTSSSTVVRFSQALGFEGFPELQEAARDEYKRRSHAPGAAPGEQSESALLTLGNSEFETALATDLVNLDESARRASLDDMSAVAGLVARSDRIVMVGVDQMAFFASYLRHLLALLDLRAEVVASASQEALGRLARIDEGALVIGFSCGRPHALVLRAAKLARKRDCATVAISDASISELTKLSDHCLYYSSNSPSYTRSHTALLSLIQALAYAVYSDDEAAYQERIRAFKLK
jgi:DNA-binding MurR/RpiR family transcriptional regulator